MSPIKSPNPVHYHIDAQFANLDFPAGWVEEGLSPASDKCVSHARDFLCRFGDTFGILPYKLVYTKDQAVYAAFRNAANENVLRIEIDEDLDVIANVSDGKSILASAFLDSDNEEKRLVRVFDPRLARAA